MKLFHVLLVAALALRSTALSIGGQNFVIKKDSDGLQNIVSDRVNIRIVLSGCLVR